MTVETQFVNMEYCHCPNPQVKKSAGKDRYCTVCGKWWVPGESNAVSKELSMNEKKMLVNKSGLHVPPQYTEAEVEEAKRQAAEIEAQTEAASRAFDEIIDRFMGRILCRKLPAAIVYLMSKLPSQHKKKAQLLLSDLRVRFQQQDLPYVDSQTKQISGAMRVYQVIQNPSTHKENPKIIGEVSVIPTGDGKLNFTSKVDSSVEQLPITDKRIVKFLKGTAPLLVESAELYDMLTGEAAALEALLDKYETELNRPSEAPAQPEALSSEADAATVSDQFPETLGIETPPEPAEQEKSPINEPEAKEQVPEKRFTKSYGA